MNTNDLRIGTIKRKEKVKLSVNGQEISAYKGETLLAALIAAGYKKLKKSPLNEEPRGALCGMGVCFECIVTVNGVPNIRSCMTEVENNMEIEIDA
jgi:sarcosine oxidase subunit alpha